MDNLSLELLVDNTDFDFRENFNLNKLMCKHLSYNNLNYI